MRELKDYQKNAIYSKKRVTFCNWKRGSGKSYVLAENIYYDTSSAVNDTNIIIVSNLSKYNECKVIYDYLRNDVMGSDCYDRISVLKSEIEVKNKHKLTTNIKFIGENEFKNQNVDLNNVDKVYFDEYIPNKSEINGLLNFDNIKKINIFTTYMDNEEFEYISDVKNKINKKEWVYNEIEELMREYSDIPKSGNTTMRRENVLSQIKMLKNLFNAD